jgi:hypothetical protein
MRRVMGFVLVALGVAVLALGVMAKPVLYDRLATVQLDQDSLSVSEGTGMSVLRASAAGVEVLTDAHVQSTRKVIGIPGKVQGHPGEAFWQTGVTSVAVGVGDLTKSQEGVSFNRKTGLATNCCGDFHSVGTLDAPDATEPIRHEGLFFKFPFNVQRTSYPFWDGELGRAEPIAYQGQDKIEGVTVYRFQQKLGPEKTGSQTGLPGALFSTDHPVDADLVYENTRTLWVEPNTGVIIKGEEQQNRRFEAAGLSAVPVTVGTIGYSDATVTDNADTWGTKGQLLKALRTTVPVGGIVVGLVLIGFGALLLVRRGGDGDEELVGHRERVPAGA